MSWGIVAVAGASIVGGAIASNSASKAAKGQERAAADSNALQQYMFDKNVELQQPTINAGNLARDSLLYRLGLSKTGSGANGGTNYTASQLRDQLTPQYTQYTQTGGGGGGGAMGGQQPGPVGNTINMATNYNSPQEAVNALGFQGAQLWAQQKFANDPTMRQLFMNQMAAVPYGPGANSGITQPTDNISGGGGVAQGGGGGFGMVNSTLDSAGLDAEVARRLAEQQAGQDAYSDQLAGNNTFGDLAQKFEFEKYAPAEKYEAGKFSYTGEDLYDDPSYKFRLDQGQKALDRQGAAAGRFLSGRQLQAASDYNQGAASQEFQNAYQRALGTFGTNETGRYNAFQTNETNRKNAFDTNEQNRFNAYQSNFSNAINPLLSLSGSGQVSAQFLGGAGQQTAQLMSNNLMGAANASGAANIAQGNAWSGAANNAAGAYQQNQLMNQLMNRNNTGTGNSWSSINNNASANGYGNTFGQNGWSSDQAYG